MAEGARSLAALAATTGILAALLVISIGMNFFFVADYVASAEGEVSSSVSVTSPRGEYSASVGNCVIEDMSESERLVCYFLQITDRRGRRLARMLIEPQTEPHVAIVRNHDPSEFVRWREECGMLFFVIEGREYSISLNNRDSPPPQQPQGPKADGKSGERNDAK